MALAGPAWDKESVQLYQSADAMVIVFDLSRSMNSTDVLPSRLERARYKAIQIIESDHNQAVGLVAFAGNAFDVATGLRRRCDCDPSCSVVTYISNANSRQQCE